MLLEPVPFTHRVCYAETPLTKWLAVHEFTNLDWLNEPREGGRFDNEWTKKVRAEIITKLETRVYGFRRHWGKQ